MAVVLGLKDEAKIHKCDQVCTWQKSRGAGVFRTGVGRLSWYQLNGSLTLGRLSLMTH